MKECLNAVQFIMSRKLSTGKVKTCADPEVCVATLPETGSSACDDGQGSFASQAEALSALQERVAAVEAASSAGNERVACLEATVQKLQAASLASAKSGNEALGRYRAAQQGSSSWPLSLFLYPFARAARWLMDVGA